MNSRTWPTLVACAAVLGLFLCATFALTRGLEHWTFEDLRRDDAGTGPARGAADRHPHRRR